MSEPSATFAPAAGAVTSTVGAAPSGCAHSTSAPRRMRRSARVERRDPQRERGVLGDGVLVAGGGVAADRAELVARAEVAGLQDGAVAVELLEGERALALAGVGLALDLGHVAGDDAAVGLHRAGQRQRALLGGGDALLGGRAHQRRRELRGQVVPRRLGDPAVRGLADVSAGGAEVHEVERRVGDLAALVDPEAGRGRLVEVVAVLPGSSVQPSWWASSWATTQPPVFWRSTIAASSVPPSGAAPTACARPGICWRENQPRGVTPTTLSIISPVHFWRSSARAARAGPSGRPSVRPGSWKIVRRAVREHVR